MDTPPPSRSAVQRPALPPAAEVTLSAADPPRRSMVACWLPGTERAQEDLFTLPSEAPALPGEPTLFTLVLPARGGDKPSATDTIVHLVPLIDLVPQLLATSAGASTSQRALSETVRAGLALIAAGRVLPCVTPVGWDAWTVAPLGPEDQATMSALATCLPPELLATPLPGTRSGQRVASPEATVAAVWDALADSLPRGASSEALTASHVYAADSPTRVPHLRTWAAKSISTRCRGAALELCLAPPTKDSPGGPWHLHLRLRSRAHPSVAVPAGQLLGSDERHRLGPTPWEDLRSELARAGRHWVVPPELAAVDHPTDTELTDDQLDALIDATDDLKRAGIKLFWPEDASLGTVDVRVELRPPTSGAFGLEELCDTRWRAHVGGRQLSADELDQLLSARRPLIRTPDGWVRVPDQLARKVQGRGPETTVGAAMAQLMAGLSAVGDADQPEAAALDAGLGTLALDDAHAADPQVVASPELVARARRLVALAEEQPADPLDIPGLEAELRHYQTRGVAWMAGLAELGMGGVLADDMGLGKTLQTIAVHALLHGPNAPEVPPLARPPGHAGTTDPAADPAVGSVGHVAGGDPAADEAAVDASATPPTGSGRSQPLGPTLVVAPTSLLGTWEREFQRFAPDTPVRRYHGTRRDLEALSDDEVVITTYGVLRRDHGELGQRAWGMIVADEAQAVKNPVSRAARSLRRVPGRFRLALTGTPVENQLGDLWSLIDWVTPGLLGTYADFRNRFADPIERHGSQASNAELRQRIAPLVLRRTKADPLIAPELPNKIERDVVVGLTTEQGALYDAAVGEALDRIAHAEGIVRRGLVLALLTSLKQICNHPAHYLDDGSALDGRSAKLEAFDDLIDSASEARSDDRSEPTLVFTQYVVMAKLLASHLSERGISHAILHGSLSPTERQRLTDEFQAGHIDVLVCSLRAAGTGLTLTRATQVIHYDRWWNPAVEDQATDRAHRIGQTATVSVHRLISEGTLEERVAEVLGQKRQLAGAVMGTGVDGWIGGLNDGELGELLRRQRPGGAASSEDAA